MTTNETTYDFNDGNGPVPAARHRNPDGSIGGWVSDCSYVTTDSYICPTSTVSGQSIVSDGSFVTEVSTVRDESRVIGGSRVTNCSAVEDLSTLADTSTVSNGARIRKESIVMSSSTINGWSIELEGAHVVSSFVSDGTPCTGLLSNSRSRTLGKAAVTALLQALPEKFPNDNE